MKKMKKPLILFAGVVCLALFVFISRFDPDFTIQTTTKITITPTVTLVLPTLTPTPKLEPSSTTQPVSSGGGMDFSEFIAELEAELKCWQNIKVNYSTCNQDYEYVGGDRVNQIGDCDSLERMISNNKESKIPALEDAISKLKKGIFATINSYQVDGDKNTLKSYQPDGCRNTLQDSHMSAFLLGK